MFTSDLIKRALEEDLGRGDITTDSVVPAERTSTATLQAKEDLVVAGLGVAGGVFLTVDRTLEIRAKVRDGAFAKKGDLLMVVKGRTRSILKAERVALNFLQRLSGIATLTRRFVDRTKGTRTKILDTRKTVPLFRHLEKYAVRMGGGVNHRFGLFDAVLIKDNHIAAMGGSVGDCVKRARARQPGTLLVVEVTRQGQIEEAIGAGADRLLLDNMPDAKIAASLKKIRKRVATEVSGGVTLDRVRRLAKLGVDYISVGALTHSAKAADISLELELP
jgi:nicotinate-nucleotide pyrophosphorylase (carboxylating)